MASHRHQHIYQHRHRPPPQVLDHRRVVQLASGDTVCQQRLPSGGMFVYPAITREQSLWRPRRPFLSLLRQQQVHLSRAKRRLSFPHFHQVDLGLPPPQRQQHRMRHPSSTYKRPDKSLRLPLFVVCKVSQMGKKPTRFFTMGMAVNTWVPKHFRSSSPLFHRIECLTSKHYTEDRYHGRQYPFPRRQRRPSSHR